MKKFIRNLKVNKIIRNLKIGLIRIFSFNQIDGKTYGKIVSSRAQYDSPENATGMEKEEFYHYAKQQKEFILKCGVKQKHKVFEIGCGYLRAGEFLISYLNKGNYIGCDISKEMIFRSNKKIIDNKLINKKPILFRNINLMFKEKELYKKKLDFIFAFSVFTHNPKKDVEECVSHISNIMKPQGKFYASFCLSKVYMKKSCFSDISYHYPLKMLQELCKKYNLNTRLIDYPGSQKILEITKLNKIY